MCVNIYESEMLGDFSETVHDHMYYIYHDESLAI